MGAHFYKGDAQLLEKLRIFSYPGEKQKQAHEIILRDG